MSTLRIHKFLWIKFINTLCDVESFITSIFVLRSWKSKKNKQNKWYKVKVSLKKNRKFLRKWRIYKIRTNVFAGNEWRFGVFLNIGWKHLIHLLNRLLYQKFIFFINTAAHESDAICVTLQTFNKSLKESVIFDFLSAYIYFQFFALDKLASSQALHLIWKNRIKIYFQMQVLTSSK